MIESIRRPRLARGLSYVLQTSSLAEALAAANIEVYADLIYWSPQKGGSILQGHYWLPNENVPYPRVYVRAGTVLSRQRPIAADWLSTQALPEFIRWLRGVLAEPGGSTVLTTEPYFNAVWTVDGPAIMNRPVFKSERHDPKRDQS